MSLAQTSKQQASKPEAKHTSCAFMNRLRFLCGPLVALAMIAASCERAHSATVGWQQVQRARPLRLQQARVSQFAARRAADDARPLLKLVAAGPLEAAESRAQSQPDDIVVGKFRAPAPERLLRQRVPSSSQFASQTLGASFRVADQLGADSDGRPVLGQQGASSARLSRPAESVQRTVGAKMLVSDEGLNYPPSKLSADIHGNVAEIVTAPPEAVDSEFLFPKSARFSSGQP